MTTTFETLAEQALRGLVFEMIRDGVETLNSPAYWQPIDKICLRWKHLASLPYILLRRHAESMERAEELESYNPYHKRREMADHPTGVGAGIIAHNLAHA